MRKTLILLASIGLSISCVAQQGFSFGIQSNNGFSRLVEEPVSQTAIIENEPGFVTSASLFAQWNFVDYFGMRAQVDGITQYNSASTKALGIIDPATIASGFGYRFNQAAFNLQASANISLNAEKTFRIEIYGGAGIRGGRTNERDCRTGLSGMAVPNDTVGTTYITASRLVNNGMQVEVVGGLRFIQRLSKPDRLPVYLTFGVGYRQTLNSLYTIEGIADAEIVPVMWNEPNGPIIWSTWPEITDDCQGVFNRTPPSEFTLQHFGQQADIQIGLKIGI